MEKTKIDWCDSTWNPITGCLHGCEYCYARGITKRFGHNLPDMSYYASMHKGLHMLDNQIDGTNYPFGFEPTFHAYRLEQYKNKKARKIFVCSMADMFGEWVPDEWIKDIFDVCLDAPQHTYLFLTKNPQRYLDLLDKDILPCEKNMWYGASATNENQLDCAIEIFGLFPWNVTTFLSIEPLLEDMTGFDSWEAGIDADGSYVDWVIIGAESGNRKDKVVPKKEWVEDIYTDCKKAGVAVFMKESLKDIYGNLVCEFPNPESWCE